MILSDKFKKVLSLMSGNKIAESILKSKKVTPYDYLDITDENDVISFVSTTKMEDVISKIEKSWEVTYNEKFLSHSDKNKKIFKELGYVIKGEKPTRPDVGIKGKIVREYTSKKTGNTFCLFKNANIEVPINKSYLKDATNLSLSSSNKWRAGKGSESRSSMGLRLPPDMILPSSLYHRPWICPHWVSPAASARRKSCQMYSPSP